MNSFCKDSEIHNDISQKSEDLFEDSFPSAHSRRKSPDRNISPLEISSDTSEELQFIHRRKQKRILSSSSDSSYCSSKKSSDALTNGLNASSSRFFCPIRSDHDVSNEVDRSKSPDSFKCDNLSKKNVEVISFVSESDQSSSILNDSQDFGNESPFSKKSFRTPLFSSVKKRTIRHWLNNVSNCSLNLEGKGLDFQSVGEPVSDEIKFSPSGKSDKSNSKDAEKLKSISCSPFDNSESKNTSVHNSYPWLFQDDNNTINIVSREQDDNVKLDVAEYSCNDSEKKSLYLNSQDNLRRSHEEILSTSLNNDINSTKFKRSSSYTSDLDNIESKKDEEHSEAYGNNDINSFHQAHSDEESFNNVIRTSRKKRNHLNSSSDDSEAKDTANDSESNHNIDPYTPRRRLYFRNPLNNSLDDDAEPVNFDCKDNKKTPAVGSENFKRSNGIINQICTEVQNMSMSDIVAPAIKNHDVSSNIHEHNIENESLSSVSEKKSESHFSNSNYSIKLDISNGSYDEKDKATSILEAKSSDTYFKDNVLQKNSQESDNEVHTLEEIPKSPSKVYNESLCSEKPTVDLNESSDSIIHLKRKSKRNLLNYSSDESFNINKSNCKENVINLDLTPGKIENDPPVLKPIIIDSDHEYDKYIYRIRSDSSSESQDDSDISKSCGEGIIEIHTTTSEDSDNENDNDPWFDLETYLKKNVPASSKSFESSCFKNMDKRKARLQNICLPDHSTSPEHTSFLLSLSIAVPEEMCHPDAVKYRGESFQKHKNELVDILFKLFNEEIFDNKLPPLEIKWSGHLTTTSGITKSSSKITKTGKIRNSIIKLSKTVVNDASKLRDTLLHELCHAANWLIDEQSGGHGPLFKKWAYKIWTIFPEIPKVKTTHHYELKWKYLYKCTYCGYELGKMKLSLNENHCRLCGGLVTVNA